MKDDKFGELISDKNWTWQPRGTSVGTLHSLLEGNKILPSDPEHGGHVKKTNIVIDSFAYPDDNPSIRARCAMAEETFNDGYRNILEVVFWSCPKLVSGGG
eukprot:3079165-Pyramimonas_sp.AAC.1